MALGERGHRQNENSSDRTSSSRTSTPSTKSADPGDVRLRERGQGLGILDHIPLEEIEECTHHGIALRLRGRLGRGLVQGHAGSTVPEYGRGRRRAGGRPAAT